MRPFDLFMFIVWGAFGILAASLILGIVAAFWLILWGRLQKYLKE